MEEHWLHVLIKVMGLLLFTLAHYSDTINLNLVNFTEFSGPEGSYFGFSTDFYQFSNKTISVVVGAPKANTSQEGVTEGGAVYICPWSKTGGSCASITFDPKGDETFPQPNLKIKSSKSHQWLGATVRSSGNYIVACAPLFHWNVVDVDERDEAQNTPVGGCLVMNTVTGGTAAFSPCRDFMTEKSYKENKYRDDRRYCEVGFSSEITKGGRLLVGAPGGYFFQGQIISAALSSIEESAKKRYAKPYVAGLTFSPETGGYDHYHGYSVAIGEFTGDSVPDFVVGVPNDRGTAGSVASYFGHSVVVTDINNDGHDDILIGAPLHMERVSGQQWQEVGQVSVFLQRERSAFLPRPDQKLTGSQMYGRFGSTVAALGDLDKDGFNDIAVGAPSSGVDGRVFIYMGTVDGLSPHYSQVIESPFRSKASPAQFGFTLRGSTDIDENGYPDLIVGAWGVNKIAVYRAQAVIMAKTQLSLDPDFLNPDVKECELPSTSKPVACFTVMMCISVSGHRIPEEIVLDAELQLDKMKQPTARRALLLQTNQPQERFQLTIQREEGVVCSNQTAYLLHETEFKDKLSPMFISLNYDLSNSNSQEAVLHGQRATAVQTRIILDCGEDNICVPDLRLTAEAGTERLLIGDDHPALLVVVAENRGEGAYEAELEIRLPAKTHYQSMVVDKEGFSRLICAQKKDNQTMVVVCELGNPMKQGQKLQAGLFFSVGNLEEVESHVTFTLQMKSKNSQNPDSNAVHLRFKVSAAAALEMRGGSSPPECVLPIAKWEQKEQPADLEEVGPLVEHVYELRNLGPSPVNARVEVDFPTRNHGDFMLYVFANASEDFLTCYTDSPDIDPYQLSRNNTDAMLYKIKWNETTRPEPQRKQTIHVNCTSGDVCVRFVCEAAGLERGWSAVVKVMSRLWVQTFLERPYENYVLQSTARYQVTDMPSKIQPEELPSGWAETQTSVVWRAPDGEKEVPVWWIIVSVVSGLFLLGLLSFIFWKMGFFKRNRPPCDDDDDEAGQLAGTGQSEYAEMPTDTDNKKT
ncbi:integrin alpha-IIb isoform X2 [Esox lucius]|uniref:integrin alpha-IIb isoform X2 n=1 Tax=Esox lucius TaxID=8010 RepID=UPI000661AB7D|nr:integrin alpha-IIb isoform X2 [Esox lucius]